MLKYIATVFCLNFYSNNLSRNFSTAQCYVSLVSAASIAVIDVAICFEYINLIFLLALLKSRSKLLSSDSYTINRDNVHYIVHCIACIVLYIAFLDALRRTLVWLVS